MIKPTIGRVVWLRRTDSIDRSQPEVAFITAVHSDTLVNVAAFDYNGAPLVRTSVHLRQDNDELPQWAANCYVEWMPYQKGQAAKTEELERAAEARSADTTGAT